MSSRPVRRAEFAKSLGAGFADAHFQINDLQFVAELGMNDTQLIGDAEQSLVNAEADFDADDEEVEAIGKREAQTRLTSANFQSEPELREHVTGNSGGDQKNERIGFVDTGEEHDGDEQNRRKNFESADRQDYVGSAIAGAQGHQLGTQ